MSDRCLIASISKGKKYQLLEQRDGPYRRQYDSTLGSAPSYVTEFNFSKIQPEFEKVVKDIVVHDIHPEDVEATKAVREFFDKHKDEFNVGQLRFPTPRWRANEYWTLLSDGSILTMRDKDRGVLIWALLQELKAQDQPDILQDVISNWLVDYGCPNPFVPRLFRFADSDSPIRKTEGMSDEVIDIRRKIATDEMLSNLYDDRMIHSIPLSKKSSLGFDKKVTKFGCSSKLRNLKEIKGKDELLRRGVLPEQLGKNSVKYTLLDKIKIILSGLTELIFEKKVNLFFQRIKSDISNEAVAQGPEIQEDLSEGIYNVGLTGWRKNNWDGALNRATGETPTFEDVCKHVSKVIALKLSTKPRAAARESENYTVEEGMVDTAKLEDLHAEINGNDFLPSVCVKWRQVTGFPHADQFVPEAVFISQTAHKIDISQIGYPTTSKGFLNRMMAIEQLERNNETEHIVVDRTNCDHQYTECADKLDKVCPKAWYWWISRFGYVILQSEKGPMVLCRSLSSGHYDTADKNSKWGRESVVELICHSLGLSLTSDFAIWFRKRVAQERRRSLDYMDKSGNPTSIQLAAIKFLYKGNEYRYYVIDGKDDQILKICHNKGAPNLFDWLTTEGGQKWLSDHKLKGKRIEGEEHDVSFGFNVYKDRLEPNDALTTNRFPFHEKISWGLAIMHRMAERLEVVPKIFVHCWLAACSAIGVRDYSYDKYNNEYNDITSRCKMDTSLFEDEYSKLARSNPEIQESLVGHVPHHIHMRILKKWRSLFRDPLLREDYEDPANYDIPEVFIIN